MTKLQRKACEISGEKHNRRKIFYLFINFNETSQHVEKKFIPRQLLASQSILQHGVIQSALIGWYSGSDIKTSVDPENSGLK